VAKTGRNEACPCGSGRKVKRCCGPAEAQARLETAADALEEALTLAEHFPRLRPQGAAFAAWAEWAAEHDPGEISIDAGIAVLDAAERERIVRTHAQEQAKAWQSLCADVGGERLAETMLLSGAVVAGVRERYGPERFRLAFLEQRAGLEETRHALSWVLDGHDLWSLIESAEADAALSSLDEGDELDDEAYETLWEATLASEACRMWTPWHDARLAALVTRMRAWLPIAGFPAASALLEAACDEFEPGTAIAKSVAADLLHGSLYRLEHALPAAA
jgi:hypothetical protein